MYLKNILKDGYAMVHTNVGKVGLNPGEIVKINERIIRPLSAHLVQVSEEEYLDYLKATGDEIPEAPETITDDNLDVPEVDDTTEQDAKDLIDAILENGTLGLTGQVIDEPEETVDEIKDEVKDDPVDLKDEVADNLSVQSEEENEEIALLQQQISDLQQTWLATTQVRKKEKLQKDIQKLQKQLAKLQEKQAE